MTATDPILTGFQQKQARCTKSSRRCATYKRSNLCQRKHLPTVAPVSLPEKVGDLEFMLMTGCTRWQRI